MIADTKQHRSSSYLSGAIRYRPELPSIGCPVIIWLGTAVGHLIENHSRLCLALG